MLQLEDAILLLQNYAADITETEDLPILESVGRILAKDQKAKEDQPPFPRSPLDGYAVKGEDTKGAARETPVKLKVVGTVYAGGTFENRIEKGETVRIMTGAPIPQGADTVIRQEDSDYGEKQVLIYSESLPYENYCRQGEDYKKGEILLKKGCLIDGIGAAMLAALGVDHVNVYRNPRISVISTGDELIDPGRPLEPGKIYDSNRYFICGRLKEMGISPIVSTHCCDAAEQVAAKIENIARTSDLIITTGGVSVGEKDIMHEVMELLSAEKLFWRISMKPGAPTLAAVYRNTLLICLSGNPFGTAANFELLVRPVIGKMTGNSKWNMEKKKVTLQNDFLKKGKVRRFVRGYVEGENAWIARGNHASGVLSSMLGCNCLIEISPDQAGARKGDAVWAYLL